MTVHWLFLYSAYWILVVIPNEKKILIQVMCANFAPPLLWDIMINANLHLFKSYWEMSFKNTCKANKTQKTPLLPQQTLQNLQECLTSSDTTQVVCYQTMSDPAQLLSQAPKDQVLIQEHCYEQIGEHCSVWGIRNLLQSGCSHIVLSVLS